MNEFQIFAHGEEFDVDAFLATTTLRPSYVWRRGDQKRYACGESSHPTSGIEFFLGDGQQTPLFEQERIAIEYLSENREALTALARYPGVATFILRLQFHMDLDVATIAFCVRPSPRLMWNVLDVGMELDFCVTLDREREWAKWEASYSARLEEISKKRASQTLVHRE